MMRTDAALGALDDRRRLGPHPRRRRAVPRRADVGGDRRRRPRPRAHPGVPRLRARWHHERGRAQRRAQRERRPRQDAATGHRGADIRRVAQEGFVDGALYERARLDYDEAAVAQAVADAGIAPAATVLDLAAGTGKLTRVLTGHVATVIAVEPQAPMRAVLAATLPAVEALDGTAEAIPLADASVDAVFAGDAFHWFDGPRALAEIDRVLRPGGVLVVVFRRPAWDEIAWWTHAVEPALAVPSAALAGPWGARAWRTAFAETTLFGSPVDASREVDVELDEDGLLAYVSSWSFVRALPDAERERTLA